MYIIVLKTTRFCCSLSVLLNFLIVYEITISIYSKNINKNETFLTKVFLS